jgi:hypothetical protein
MTMIELGIQQYLYAYYNPYFLVGSFSYTAVLTPFSYTAVYLKINCFINYIDNPDWFKNVYKISITCKDI